MPLEPLLWLNNSSTCQQLLYLVEIFEDSLFPSQDIYVHFWIRSEKIRSIWIELWLSFAEGSIKLSYFDFNFSFFLIILMELESFLTLLNVKRRTMIDLPSSFYIRMVFTKLSTWRRGRSKPSCLMGRWWPRAAKLHSSSLNTIRSPKVWRINTASTCHWATRWVHYQSMVSRYG